MQTDNTKIVPLAATTFQRSEFVHKEWVTELPLDTMDLRQLFRAKYWQASFRQLTKGDLIWARNSARDVMLFVERKGAGSDSLLISRYPKLTDEVLRAAAAAGGNRKRTGTAMALPASSSVHTDPPWRSVASR